jgi:hypothetical protein
VSAAGRTQAQATDSGSAAEAVKEKAAEAGQQAQQQAQQAASRLQDRAREQIDERSTRLGAQVREQADDLRSVSASLREQGKEGPARAADRLAGYAARVGDYLNEKDSQGLLHDAEQLGRRQPLALGAAGAALGFAASRFLKASSRERYHAVRPSQTGAPSVPPVAISPPAVATAAPIPPVAMSPAAAPGGSVGHSKE